MEMEMEDYKGIIMEKALGSGYGVRSYRQLHDVDAAYHHHHAVGGGLDNLPHLTCFGSDRN